ncbi:hypothetical protein G7B40_000340 [Aetokthonos hydrillicola Thurmond2011]|uniref:Uncharacterized protein n=1 Tax=Aetokthonos hydrillicola Thurmond2011 TaxID=2712845 RepID=A0AAP5I3C3_9CYAN|nr:hypothetical protein [Aetokthonos hydrillicola]MBO3460177.1 hypothetical protein [Aetokthonos hydrillicola CCALA 1050]MBW4590557.1 hypothetical protein [Aetokthonos hydrillicola CCALA 1050]MDR9893034.1 hypothetical protein [Aetokthonos hydrillicola Thurmond2011]
MSGTKTYSVSGITPLAAQAVAAGVAVAGFVVASGVMATGAAVVMAAKSVQAYQERLRREREKAIQQEEEIQRQIAEARRSYPRNKTIVKLPETRSQPIFTNVPVNNDAEFNSRDLQIKIREQKSRLPRIREEYQRLIEQELLDELTVLQALRNVEQTLDSGNVAAAEVHLQALDDARIEAFEQLRSQLQSEAEYAQARLDAIEDHLPKELFQDLETEIERIRRSDRPFTDPELLAIHQQITAAELQANRVWDAAENLVKAWQSRAVDYKSQIIGIDDGDVIVEIETHENQDTGEKVNTVMRVQFDGQQIDLFGPREETTDCAARTGKALQIFQEQGYYLEWDSLDEQPVPEEYKQVYSAQNVATLKVEPPVQESPKRRLETESY